MWCFTCYISLSLSTLFPKGVSISGWLHGETMTHPRLKHLLKSLSAILIQDRVLKTVRTYGRAHEAWPTWAVQCKAPSLPANPAVFSFYLVHFIQQDQSASSINSAIYGASWVHKKSGFQQLIDYCLCSGWPRLQEGSLLGHQVAGGLWKPARLSAICCLEQGPLSYTQYRWLLCLLWVSLASIARVI